VHVYADVSTAQPENVKVPPLLAQAAAAVPVYPVAQVAVQADAAIVAEAVLQLVSE